LVFRVAAVAVDNPDSRQSCSASALSLNQHQQYQAARNRLDECLRLYPQDANLHELQGLVLDSAGARKRAGDELQEALQLAGGNANYRIHLATSLAKSDLIDDATERRNPIVLLDNSNGKFSRACLLGTGQKQENAVGRGLCVGDLNNSGNRMRS
jgi:Flp pilus assembly protein TadD